MIEDQTSGGLPEEPAGGEPQSEAGAPRLRPSPHLYIHLDYPDIVRPRPSSYKYEAVEKVLLDNLPEIEETLAALTPWMESEQLAAVPDEKQNETDPYWNNGFFAGSDARAAYAFAAWLQPRQIVEIGSGNSTKFFRKSIIDHRSSSTLTCIDPAPRAEISEVADVIIRESVLQVPMDVFAGLESGDILFLDGSHLCFSGTDTVHFFLDILPIVKPGVAVHVHDITLPYEYPDIFKERFYAEQYVLATCLIGSRLLKPIFPVTWLKTTGRCPGPGGVSFWCRRI